MSAGTEARSPDEQSSTPLSERARGCPTEVVAQFGYELVLSPTVALHSQVKVLLGSFRPGKSLAAGTMDGSG